MASTVTDYCTVHSENISENMQELWAWTCQEFDDADKMSSPLQGVSKPEARTQGLREANGGVVHVQVPGSAPSAQEKYASHQHELCHML